MRLKLVTDEFVGYFSAIADLMDFMENIDKAYKWTLIDEENDATLMTGGGDYGQDS